MATYRPRRRERPNNCPPPAYIGGPTGAREGQKGSAPQPPSPSRSRASWRRARAPCRRGGRSAAVSLAGRGSQESRAGLGWGSPGNASPNQVSSDLLLKTAKGGHGAVYPPSRAHLPSKLPLLQLEALAPNHPLRGQHNVQLEILSRVACHASAVRRASRGHKTNPDISSRHPPG